MSIEASGDQINTNEMEKHIANLAAVLETHGLSRIEYHIDDEGTNVILEKKANESERLLQHATLVSPNALAMNAYSAAQPGLAFGVQNANDSVAAGTLPANVVNPTVLLAGENTDTTANNGTEIGVEVDTQLVSAPLVGIAYQAKEPGSTPFVQIGDHVKEGSVLCLIEAMKMFNEVKATVAGTIQKIHFEDASLVEYGAPLYSIEIA